MFAKETDGIVEQLIDAEHRNAVELWGATYKDKFEAREVLREEIVEAVTEVREMHKNFFNIDEVEARAKNAIKELAQVCAVIRKIRASGFDGIDVKNEIKLPESKKCGECEFFGDDCPKIKEAENNYGYDGCMGLFYPKEDYAACDDFQMKKCGECKNCYLWKKTATENIFACRKNDDVVLESDKACSAFEPKKTYRPFKDTDELIAEFKKRFNVNCPDYAMPLIWIEQNEMQHLITAFTENCVFLSDSQGLYAKELLNEYTFLDGSPCGIMEVQK